MNVGLTGGIASGKSTVAKMFQEKGACLIDFDEIAHYVEEPDRPAWKAIIEYFGAEILNEDRTINRTKLGAIVFKDREKLAVLGRIVHPHILPEWRKRMNEIREAKPDGIFLSDVPLLIEGRLQHLVDVVALVYISPDEQIERLMKRNGCSREDALERLASQMPIDDKIQYADIIIDNHGPLERTREIVSKVWEELLKRKTAK
ncbi:MAG: dephospho-CoA kinase [Syntrophobacterales bacterium CG_4_8_14_3_um_filter_49_14]|nr:MAG: dephospho-CoA kinase [Syntrophobacterales bacterium CG23_combo_of_CG06-09_8_20_14_all_48_27]PJA48473.1 MAG: dephospho-CoA kinase [Syntrophobacterales bacterium CG_4_9_14_3_um_filter_49_8]PJC73912.1 MAG: dephospho-CoA kinase [Syntrophobacterales bacterium CG_4_8_14_3_um_filter_49_14]